MLGKIKVIGANNRSHLDWMEKEFENCSICHNGNTLHFIKIPERDEIPFEIYKTILIEDRMILEGYANIEDMLGRLAIEFSPQ